MLDVINLRLLDDGPNPKEEPVEEALRIAPIACVQNQYNMIGRADDALVDILAAKGIAYLSSRWAV